MSDQMLRELVVEIESIYESLGYVLGWRFLTSPRKTLSPKTEVCLVTLNPGGSADDLVNPRASNEQGSAYVVESWGNDPPGRSRLQIQVQTLFQLAGIETETVLSGHLVPFRSVSWDSLQNKPEAMRLGVALWTRVLDYVRPSLILGIGKTQLRQPLAAILGKPTASEEVPMNWGAVSAGFDQFGSCSLITLPHLSRFSVATRAQSTVQIEGMLARAGFGMA